MRVIRHKTNRGAAAARNTGMRKARGEWLAFLDSDEVWLPGTLASRLKAAMVAAAWGANPLTVWAAGFRYVNSDSHVSNGRIPISSDDVRMFASGCWFCPGSTALFRKARIIEHVGVQDETLERLEELDWFLRLGLAGGRLAVFRRLVADIRLGDKPDLGKLERAGQVLREKFDRVPLLDGQARDVGRRLTAYLAVERASIHWHNGRYAAAIGEIGRSLFLVSHVRLQLERFWRNA